MLTLQPQENERLGEDLLANPTAIDRSHLARYTFGDADLEAEILTLFVDQSMSLLQQLRAAESQAAWRFATHSIKGSARAVGAWRVADVAQGLETMAYDADTVPAALAGLEGAMMCAIGEARRVCNA
ncbi:MAG: Hpt domain-containing protein [Pseudomonadota bacterium]